MHLAARIKEETIRLGFAHCGFSKATSLDAEARYLEKWLEAGRHGKMSYMERHFEKRIDPRKLVEGTKTIVSLLLNYYPTVSQSPDAPKISRYAYGTDYHTVLKEKLAQLMAFIRLEAGDVNGRAFVDSAPVMDKVWAQKSGLGWQGKHSNLIHKSAGSYFFIAELLIDIELPEDGPVSDHCGTCTKCIDACPTQAIVKPYEVDASRCISYLTIELKENLPVEFQAKMDGWAFGCDVCQEVCPWNSFALPHQEAQFNPIPEILEMSVRDWQEITEDVFKKVFSNSPLSRPGFSGLQRNITFAFHKNDGGETDI